jgi:plasmid stabilization system protein ParE
VTLLPLYLPAAERDIDLIADFLAADNLDAALRFYAAVRADVTRLAEMPGLGTRWFDSSGDRESYPRRTGYRTGIQKTAGLTIISAAKN